MEQLHDHITVSDLFLHLDKADKEKIWTVLEFLQGEQLIQVDERGGIKKINP